MNSTRHSRNRTGPGSDRPKRNSGLNNPISRHPFDTNNIVLTGNVLPPGLFSEVAENAARYVANGKPDAKPTQLRKFYDEICMWNKKCERNSDRFQEHLPFILMLKAKVAYAKGRGHVNSAYENVVNQCLSELDKTPKSETLYNLKTFMEAFTGFYKVYGPTS